MTTFSPAVAPVLHRLVDCGITLRELEVIDAIADGLTREETGQRLHLSERTVQGHLHAIGRRAGTGNRSGIVGYAYREGLLQRVPEPRVALSPGVRHAIRLAALGLEDDEIGLTIGVTEDTVGYRLSVATKVLGSRNRAHTVRRAVDTGALPLAVAWCV